MWFITCNIKRNSSRRREKDGVGKTVDIFIFLFSILPAAACCARIEQVKESDFVRRSELVRMTDVSLESRTAKPYKSYTTFSPVTDGKWFKIPENDVRRKESRPKIMPCQKSGKRLPPIVTAAAPVRACPPRKDRLRCSHVPALVATAPPVARFRV